MSCYFQCVTDKMKSLSCKNSTSKKGDGCGLGLRTNLLNGRQKAVHTETVGEFFFKKKASDEKKKLPSNKLLYDYQKCIKKKIN